MHYVQITDEQDINFTTNLPIMPEIGHHVVIDNESREVLEVRHFIKLDGVRTTFLNTQILINSTFHTLHNGR